MPLPRKHYYTVLLDRTRRDDFLLFGDRMHVIILVSGFEVILWHSD